MKIRKMTAALLVSLICLTGCGSKNQPAEPGTISGTVVETASVTTETEEIAVETEAITETVISTETESETEIAETETAETAVMEDTGMTDEKETVSEQEQKDSLAEIYSMMEENGALCAVAYVGYVETQTAAEVTALAASCVIGQDYPFIPAIDVDHYALEEGKDVYCIVPSKEAKEVIVNDVKYDMAGEPVNGEVFYQGDAKPFLLLCNISDIMPNSFVSMNVNGTPCEFSVFMSLKDGSMEWTPKEAPVCSFYAE